MTESAVLVLDASVGVKWFKPEGGQEAALAVLEAALAGHRTVIVPVHFAHEVLSVVRRRYGAEDMIAAWQNVLDAGITLVPLSDDVVREAAAQCAALRCTFYDALAPAVASLLGATLVSADARAHSTFPGVELIG